MTKLVHQFQRGVLVSMGLDQHIKDVVALQLNRGLARFW
jgi:hypothetical protein